MGTRGRQSAASLSVVRPEDSQERPEPPKGLDAKAKKLWRDIVAERPSGFYSQGDLPLLLEYVITTAVYLPKANEALKDSLDQKALETREKLVRLAESLAMKLRICVSSRTRPDTAKMRDSVKPAWAKPKLWE